MHFGHFFIGFFYGFVRLSALRRPRSLQAWKWVAEVMSLVRHFQHNRNVGMRRGFQVHFKPFWLLKSVFASKHVVRSTLVVSDSER